MIRIGVFLSLVCVFALPVSAADRALSVRSRLGSALGAILPSSDYLIVVNRADALDSSEAVSADGPLKELPGLDLGVDARGEVVVHGAARSSYLGPLVIKIIVDESVNRKTYKMIEELAGEIAGGLQDQDELKISRGFLRQAVDAKQAPPTVSINNQSDPFPLQEQLKFLAVLATFAGLALWAFSRFSAPKTNASAREYHPPETRDREAKVEESADELELLDPAAVALFLMKSLRENRATAWKHWSKVAPPALQREVLSHFPPWVVTHARQQVAKFVASDAGGGPDISSRELFGEIAVLERAVKEEARRRKSFLRWFPAEALRYVPKSSQRGLSEASRRTLWALRPDLGNFARVEGLGVDVAMAEPDEAACADCVRELYALPSTEFENDDGAGLDVTDRWIQLVNGLHEFGPIDAQVEQARAKLPSGDFERFRASVAHLRTPETFSDGERKQWLREVTAEDYYWWLKLAGREPHASLDVDLRPMRLAIFRQARIENAAKSWTEVERKESSRRLLEGFRSILARRSSERGTDAA